MFEQLHSEKHRIFEKNQCKSKLIPIHAHPSAPLARFQCLQNISRKIGKGDNLSEDTPVTTYKSKRLLFTP